MPSNNNYRWSITHNTTTLKCSFLDREFLPHKSTRYAVIGHYVTDSALTQYIFIRSDSDRHSVAIPSRRFINTLLSKCAWVEIMCILVMLFHLIRTQVEYNPLQPSTRASASSNEKVMLKCQVNMINIIKLSSYRLETLLVRTVTSYCSQYTLSVPNVFLTDAVWLQYNDVSKYRNTVLLM